METPEEPADLSALPEYKTLFGHRKPVLLVKPVKHVLSHRIIYADLYKVTIPPSLKTPPEFIRVSQARVEDYAVSRLVQKLLEKAELL